VRMNLAVIRAELQEHISHLHFHEFNRVALGEPRVSVETVFENWRTIQEALFTRVKAYIVSVPLDMTATGLRETLTPHYS